MKILYIVMVACVVTINYIGYRDHHKPVYLNEYGDVAHTCYYGIQYIQDRKGGIHPLYKNDGTFISCHLKETGEK